MDSSVPIATYFSDPEPPATSVAMRYWDEEDSYTPCLLLRRETPGRSLTDHMHALQLSTTQCRPSERDTQAGLRGDNRGAPQAASVGASNHDGGRRARRRSHELWRAPQVVSASAPTSGTSRSSSSSSNRLSRRHSRRRPSRAALATAPGVACHGDAAALQYYGLLPAVQPESPQAGAQSEPLASSSYRRASTEVAVTASGANRGSRADGPLNRGTADSLSRWAMEERRTQALTSGGAGEGNVLMHASEVCRRYLEFVSQR